MDGSVAEGISTSFQTCPLSQSHDPQKLHASEGLPSPPSSLSNLHVNDLGLTPSPGSQQQQPVDASHVSSQNESDKGEAAADNLATKDSEQQGEGMSIETGENLYDPLFDSDFPLQDLESDFLSHKRAHDNAFPGDFDFEGPPDKRQAQESSDSTNELSNETPSLSPDLSHRPDQFDTALNTPVGLEASQTPNSFFDSLDLLLQDPAFPTLLGGEDFTANTLFDNLPKHHKESHALKPTPVSEHITAPFPSISDATKQRFSIDAQDLTANASKEVLQRPSNVPQYSSPYPAYGGPLGYLPSAPGHHVRCIEVADEHMNFRLESLRDKNQQLTTERNKYKKFFDEFSTVDPATGKTKQQLLLEENSNLRRVSTRHQTRVEYCKKEIEDWKGRLNEVSTMYNNLIYEIAVQRRLPEVAPPPPRYKPRPVQGVYTPLYQGLAVPDPRPQLQPAPTPPASIGFPQHPLPGPATQQEMSTTTPSANQPPCQPPCGSNPAPTTSRSSQAVTVDLTEDDPAPALPPSPRTLTNRAETLQSLKQKKYHWLEGRNQVSGTIMSQTQPSANAPPSAPPNAQNIDIGQDDGRDAGEDELARMMEEELAQGS